MQFKNQRIVGLGQSFANNKFIEIPELCPNCGVSNNPTTTFKTFSEKIVFFKHLCTSCNKVHYSLQNYASDQGKCIALYPNQQLSKLPERVTAFSPRFEEMYQSAERTESNISIDLAGMGYRAALEILLKDYALYFELDTYDEIAKLNLNNAISKYFKTDVDSLIAADVVRILGNDYAHWEQKEEPDIEMLKSYLEIFIQIINTKLMLKNPPVSRTQKTT